MNTIMSPLASHGISLLGAPFWKPFVPNGFGIEVTARPYFTDHWVSPIELFYVYNRLPTIVIANLLKAPLIGNDCLETKGTGSRGQACVLWGCPAVVTKAGAAPVRPNQIPGRSGYPNADSHGDGDPDNSENWVIAFGVYDFYSSCGIDSNDPEEDYRGGVSFSVGDDAAGPGIAFKRTGGSYSFSVVADLDAYLASFQNQVFADTNLGVLAADHPTIFQSGNGKDPRRCSHGGQHGADRQHAGRPDEPFCGGAGRPRWGGPARKRRFLVRSG